MMLTLLAATLLTAQNLPENPSVTFTGIPTLTRNGAQVPGVRVLSHSATLELRSGKIQLTSLTLFRNDSDAPVSADLTVPRRAYQNAGAAVPEFPVRLQWDQAVLSGNPLTSARNATRRPELVLAAKDLRAQVTMVPKGTHALRLSANLPLGSGGPDGQTRLVAYQRTGSAPIGQFQLAFRYPEQGSVFNLPTITPSANGWEIGTTGAHFRRNEFQPDGEVTVFRFYGGGFEPIGE